MNTPLSSIILVVIGSFIGSFGAVFLKSGANRLRRNLPALLSNWRLAVGIGAYLLSTVFFISAVKHGELSILYPLVSLGYLWTLIWSRLFFQEPVTRNKLFGVSLILCGIVCLFIGR